MATKKPTYIKRTFVVTTWEAETYKEEPLLNITGALNSLFDDVNVRQASVKETKTRFLKGKRLVKELTKTGLELEPFNIDVNGNETEG
jgi:hypothetical protein